MGICFHQQRVRDLCCPLICAAQNCCTANCRSADISKGILFSILVCRGCWLRWREFQTDSLLRLKNWAKKYTEQRTNIPPIPNAYTAVRLSIIGTGIEQIDHHFHSEAWLPNCNTIICFATCTRLHRELRHTPSPVPRGLMPQSTYCIRAALTKSLQH